MFLFPSLQSDDNASFLRAARGGNLEKVLEYLKGSTDINTSNAVGTFALSLSVYYLSERTKARQNYCDKATSYVLEEKKSSTICNLQYFLSLTY